MTQADTSSALARARTVYAMHGVDVSIGAIDHGNKLILTLDTALNSTKYIPTAQEQVYALLEEAKHKATLRNEEINPIELEAREWQLFYIEQHLTRASRIATKRQQILNQIRTQKDVDAEIARCKADKVYWFENYAWGYDPRARTALSIVPFALYPKQQELVEWIDDLVFRLRSSGLVEKARDEGATELMVRWGLYHWLFTDGFSMLLSSRTEDEVDTKKKQGTLFERARFQIRLLPPWMLPRGFDIDKDLLPDKMISNPVNGNALVGQAPVENMGRGDRVTCALFDEFAFWRFGGYPQYRSMSQTTDSILMPSSVGGRLNQYADLASDGVTPKFVMDWRDNPFKDKKWYNALPYGYISPKMTKTTIAQEIDRDYDASQPGKVWKPREEYLFINLEEFLRPFKAAKMDHKFFDEQGKFRIPKDWRWARTSDYGQTDDHDWSYSIGAQPREVYPLHDTHFVFVAENLTPTGLTIAEGVKQWREIEQRFGLRDASGNWINPPYGSWNSHEQKDLRKVLLEQYGETWVAWQPDYNKGIAQIDDWFTVIDVETPNPYRPELYGRCKMVFVSLSNEYRLAKNERTNSYFVTISESERSFMTARKQISAYHYPQTELGKAVKDMRPEKTFDDIVDALRGYATMWNSEPDPLTTPEKLAQKAKDLTIYNNERKDEVSVAAQISRDFAFREARKQLKEEEGIDTDAYGNEKEVDWETRYVDGW